VYWLGTDINLSERRHQNWLYLHARRQPFTAFAEIADALLRTWPYGDMCCVNDFVQRFGSHWSETEVEAAVWKLVGDAAAEGRLLVDLAEVELSLSTKFSLLAPGTSPILPDPLPSELMLVESDTSFPQETETEDLALDPQSGITGPTFDASVLATTEEQAHFHRNLAAVTAVLAGMGTSGAARAYGMATSTLSRLVGRTKEFGQIACVPYATYHRDRALHPDLQQLIRKLYTQPFRPTVMAICDLTI
jgi:helix-turn-helix, Psq domain